MKKFFSISMLLACALQLPVFAQSQNVSIFPVTLVGGVETRSQAVTLKNHGTRPVRYQIDAYTWTQADGQHLHAKTGDVLATPAIVEIPPQGERVVRAMRVLGQGTAYYRLMIRELPEVTASGSTVRMPIHHNLALAFEPTHAPLPTLSAQPQPGGYLLTNPGTTAARVTAIGPDGGEPWRQGSLGWVLPGSSLLMEVDAKQRASRLNLTVNGQPVSIPSGS